MTSSMHRVMRYWTQKGTGSGFEIPPKVMELNQDHPVVKQLVAINTEKPESNLLKAVVLQMFDNGLLAEGDLPDPALVVPRLNQIMEMLVLGKDDVPPPEIDVDMKEEDLDEDQPQIDGHDDDQGSSTPE